MLNELQHTLAQGMGKSNPNSKELSVKTIIFQGTGKIQSQLETTDAPKYDTIPTLIDSGCMETAMDTKWA